MVRPRSEGDPEEEDDEATGSPSAGERLIATWVRARRRILALRAAGRAWVRRHLPDESQHLFALTLVVGVVCGLTAVAFHLAIHAAEALLIDRALDTANDQWMLWTIFSPTVGGLLAGVALTWLVPGAAGSGIPQVKQAYATEGGRVRFRDALGKFIIGAMQIGSGASLGREGPTVQICAGATSMLARATSLPPRNMRRLTPVGVAAGIAAAFNAPIAAVTFTIEEIVGALDHTVLSGVVVAAALAAVIERGVLGVHPVIQVDTPYGLDHASSLAVYALLGLAASIVSVAFSDSLLRLRAWFRDFKAVPRWAHPAVGGLVTGVLAVIVLRFLGTTGVNGGGYDTLGRALAGELGLRVLLALCVVKTIATVFSYSSGGAGGIFAPALFVGAMLGGAFGYLDVWLLDHEKHQLGAFALVGMGAVFAGVIRAPITSVLIIFEMTGGYGLVLPLMLANMTSYMLARRLRPLPIYEALLQQDGIALPRATPRVHALDQLTVADAMTRDVVCAAPHQTLAAAAAYLADQPFASAPVMDERGVALGLVGIDELRRNAKSTEPVTRLLKPAHSIYVDVPLVRAVVRMNDLGVRQLLVVDRGGGNKLVGILAISDLVRAHARAAPLAPPQVTGSEPPPPILCASRLMAKTAVVAGPSRLSDLSAHMHDSGSLIVQSGEQYGVLLSEDLGELSGDEGLEKLLIAADLARPAPCVDEGAGLQELVRAINDTQAGAAIVVTARSREPVGVVTRAALGAALLDWFAANDPSAAAATV